MKHIILTILFYSSLVAHGQNYQLEFDSYNATYTHDWRGFDSQDSHEVKKKFIDFVESKGYMEAERRMLVMMGKKLLWSIKAVDLNNDNKTDIIYTGPTGGEGTIVYIYLQNNDNFIKNETFQQGIMKVTWDGELLDKLYIRDWGCCADPNLTNQVYQVNYVNGAPSYELIWESIEIEEFIAKPKSLLETPIRFEVSNEEYKLRAEPKIDDSTENYHLEITGNTIGILKKGFTGTAYAESIDDTGRVWWYVVIGEQFEVKEAYINYDYHNPKPHLLGWMSSRFVERIE